MTTFEKAIKELRNAGVYSGLPTEKGMQEKPNSYTWRGTKKNGDPWELKKNSPTSFNVMC